MRHLQFRRGYTGCQPRGKPGMWSAAGRPPAPFDQPSARSGPFRDGLVEINKILGAILFTCLVMLALNIAAGAMFSPAKPAKPGYEIAVTEEPAQGAKPEGAAPAGPS